MKRFLFLFLLEIILICLIFFIDYKASVYGNSFIFRKFFNEIPILESRNDIPLYVSKYNFYPLKYGLTLYNHNSITYDGGWGYITEGSDYITKSGQKINIKNIKYYSVTNAKVIIGVETNINKIENIVFVDSNAVYEKNPIIIRNIDFSEESIKIIKLDENMPPMFYIGG